MAYFGVLSAVLNDPTCFLWVRGPTIKKYCPSCIVVPSEQVTHTHCLHDTVLQGPPGMWCVSVVFCLDESDVQQTDYHSSRCTNCRQCTICTVFNASICWMEVFLSFRFCVEFQNSGNIASHLVIFK